MSRVRLALRLAGRTMARARTATALSVLLIALPVFVSLLFARAGQTGPDVVVALVTVALVFVILRGVLALGERNRTRTGALLAVNGARTGDLELARFAECLLLATAGTVLAAGAHALVFPGWPTALAGGGIRGQALPTTLGVLIGVPLLASLATISGSTDRITTDFRSTIAGRRPSRPTTARTAIIAAVLLVAGIVLIGAAPTGAAALCVPVGIGLVALALWPGIAWLLDRGDPAAQGAGVAMRLATRSLSRQRYRTTPLLVLIVVFLTVAVVHATGYATIVATREAKVAEIEGYDLATAPDDLVIIGPDIMRVRAASGSETVATVPDATVGAVRAEVPGSTKTSLEILRDTMVRSWNPLTGAFGSAAVGVATPDVLRALHLEHLQSELDTGRVIALNPLAVDPDGDQQPTTVTIRAGGSETQPITYAAVTAWPDRIVTQLPAALVPPDGLPSGATVATTTVLVQAPGSIDDDAIAAVLDLTRDHVEFVNPDGSGIVVTAQRDQHLIWEQGQASTTAVPGRPEQTLHDAAAQDLPIAHQIYEDQAEGYVVIALVVLVIAVAAAVALGASQRRRDDELLLLQGASPTLRRRVGAIEAAILAGLGATVASVVGLLTTGAGIAFMNRLGQLRPYPPPQLDYAQPWSVTLLVLVVLPLLLAGAAFVLTPPVRRLHLRDLSDDS